MKTFCVISFICTAIFLNGCAGSSEPTQRAELENGFSDEFGFKPDTNIAEIKCKVVQVGDTWSRWMRFTYDSNTVVKIIANGFKPVTDELLKDNVHSLWEAAIDKPSPNAPAWWKKPTQVVGVTYFKENPFRENSPSNSMPSFCFFWIDKSQGEIYSESHIWQ